MENKLKISHTILYTKNWYLKSNIWEDMIKTLTCDDYTPFDKGDVLSILMSNFEKLPHTIYQKRIQEIVSGISPRECWKRGYYTNQCTWMRNYQNFPEWDYYEAVVRFILSVFSELSIDEFVKVEPDYINCLPSPQKQTA